MQTIGAVLERFKQLGHEPTAPLQAPIGNKRHGWFIACERCEAYVTVDKATGIVAGSLASVKCGEPIPKKQAANKPTSKKAVKPAKHIVQAAKLLPSGFQADPNAVPLTTHLPNVNVPSGIAPCDYCGNGSTLVGKSCKHCGYSQDLLNRTSKPTSYYGAALDGRFRLVLPQSILYERQAYILGTFEDGNFIAPCGFKTTQRGVYVTRGWRPNKQAATNFVYRYGCPCACTVPEMFDELDRYTIQALLNERPSRQADALDDAWFKRLDADKRRWLQAIVVAAIIIMYDWSAVELAPDVIEQYEQADAAADYPTPLTAGPGHYPGY